MIGALGLLGVGAKGERLYRLLLRHPRASREELAALVGIPSVQLPVVLDALVRLGLVREEADGALTPAPPHGPVESYVEQELARVEARRRHLEEVRAAIGELAAEHLNGLSGAWAPASVHEVTGDEITLAFEDLARVGGGSVLVLQDVPASGRSPWGTDLDRLARHFDGSVPGLRCVYPAAAMQEEARAAFVTRIHAMGGQVRLVEAAEHRFVVFGTGAAIVSSRPGDDAPHHLLIRSAELVAVLRELFERTWRSAVPVDADVTGSADDRRRLVELLATGIKDEAIARHLGLSLRTVRRRIADLMDDLGTSTRFQAGLEAARRGLV